MLPGSDVGGPTMGAYLHLLERFRQLAPHRTTKRAEAIAAGAERSCVLDPDDDDRAAHQRRVQNVRGRAAKARVVRAQDRESLALKAHVLDFITQDLRAQRAEQRRAG